MPTYRKPTRLGFGYLEDGSKERIAKKSGAMIPRSAALKDRREPRPEASAKDTKPELVLEVTYVPPTSRV